MPCTPPGPHHPAILAPARRHGNRPARVAGRRVTHSMVASAGMRSAGPSVRSPRPEQLTRQAAPGAGPHWQGGAQGPQPRPGPPASAPSHRPRTRASSRRAGSIVRAARAWPRPGARPAPAAAAQARPAIGMAGRGVGSRGGRGLPACLPACATSAQRSSPAALRVHRRPLARSRCTAGRHGLLLLPARSGLGGASSGSAPCAVKSEAGGEAVSSGSALAPRYLARHGLGRLEAPPFALQCGRRAG